MKYTIYNKHTSASVTSINQRKFSLVIGNSWRWYCIFQTRRNTKNPMSFSLKSARKFLQLNSYRSRVFKIKPI
jgi:hypothetical protein